MRTVDYDGELLRVKFTAAGNTWSNLIALVKTLPGREFLMAERMWVMPPLRKSLETLQQHNFTFTPKARQLYDSMFKAQTEGGVIQPAPVNRRIAEKLKGFRP